jgi:ABC-type dipeptide/oligopeptide/nickel transport system permease component
MTVVIFMAIHLIPGDPVSYIISDMPYASPELIAQLRAQFGLDKPLYEQYLSWLTRMIQGDWGVSLRTWRPVIAEVGERYPNTVRLAIAGIITAVSIGVPAGVLAAVKHNTKVDYLCMTGALFGVSMPSFWLGIMLILIFSVQLKLLPTSGSGALSSLIMPALTLGLVYSGSIARITRSGMLEVLRQDYIRTARAKGLTERIVVYRHALKNALIPLLTLTGMQFGFLLGGTVIVETVFAWPGIGRLAVMAIQTRDLPMLQGCILVLTVMFVAINLAVDILYAFIDPRIKYE